MDCVVRLKNELSNFNKSRPFGCFAFPDQNDFMEWSCLVHHKGFYYSFKLKFKSSYPITPPVLRFNKKVFHPNIYHDRYVCLDILASKWSPSFSIKDIVIGLKQLFDNPNPDSPANEKAADLLVNSPDKYNKEVQNCNKANHTYYDLRVYK